MTLQGEMSRIDRIARRSWTAFLPIRGGVLLRVLCGVTAAVLVMVLAWLNVILGLGAAALLLMIAVVSARARNRLLSRHSTTYALRNVVDAAILDEPTVPLFRARVPGKDTLPAVTQLDPPPVEESVSDPVPVTVGIAVPDQPAAAYVVISNVVVGRGQQAGLAIDDPTVSRRHVSLIWRDGRWHLRQEKDAATIVVNGKRLRSTRLIPLTDGDEIALGTRGTLLTWGVFVPAASGDGLAAELVLAASANTIPGARPANEDAYLVGPSLIAVADGAGGELAGAVASATAIDVLESPEMRLLPLSDVVAAANDAVIARQNHPSHAGMTSLDILRLARQGSTWMLEIAHLGDGVAFLQKPDGSVHRLTTPHRSVSSDGRRAGLDRALGSDGAIEAQYVKMPAEPGQRFLLATDGLLDHFGEERLVKVLREHFMSTPRRVADALVRTAVEENARDNVTVVAADVRVTSLEEEPIQELSV